MRFSHLQVSNLGIFLEIFRRPIYGCVLGRASATGERKVPDGSHWTVADANDSEESRAIPAQVLQQFLVEDADRCFSRRVCEVFPIPILLMWPYYSKIHKYMNRYYEAQYISCIYNIIIYHHPNPTSITLHFITQWTYNSPRTLSYIPREKPQNGRRFEAPLWSRSGATAMSPRPWEIPKAFRRGVRCSRCRCIHIYILDIIWYNDLYIYIYTHKVYCIKPPVHILKNICKCNYWCVFGLQVISWWEAHLLKACCNPGAV